ncbi:MAG: endonuclease/exonuclease/phosphatase family protein [Ferruginibacter sp.]
MEIVLSILSLLLISCLTLSLVRHDFWLYKIMEYPRLQIVVLVLTMIAGWFCFWPLELLFYKIIFGGLILSMCYLFYKILPYTSLSKIEMHRVDVRDRGNELKIFSANVYQENKEYGRLLEQVKNEDPDIIFLLETNAAWAEGVASLEKDYPYTLLLPLENTYGLLFFSRLKLERGRVNFLVKDDIPSIEAVIHLPSGKTIQLWGLHPEPPVPGENLYATAKNKELMIVAFKAKKCTSPAIVFGDLNDVAWSHTTELFRKTSELLDPRRGRGFYNTFSAHHWYIRFPLDYVFCSKEFGLVAMKRMPKNGSDHFATLTHISLRPDLIEPQEGRKADKEELREAREMIMKTAEG